MATNPAAALKLIIDNYTNSHGEIDHWPLLRILMEQGWRPPDFITSDLRERLAQERPVE